jgi:trigger factor
MVVTEVLKEGLKRKFRIELPYTFVKERRAQLIKSKGKTYKMQGFRPGHVPFPTLEKMFGNAALESAISEIVQETTQKALSEKKITVVDKPKYALEPAPDAQEGQEPESFSYTLEFEIQPTVPDQDFKALTLEKVKVTIDAKDVDDLIQEWFAHHKTPKKITKKRKSQKGDVLFADMVVQVKGDEDSQMKGIEILLHPQEVGEELFKELENRSEGDDVTCHTAVPQNAPNKKLRGKKLKTQVHIREIRERVPLESREELAKALNFKSVEDLEKHAMKALEAKGQEFESLWEKRQILDFLTKGNTFDLPESLVEREFNTLYHQALYALNLKPEEDKAHAEERDKKIQEAYGRDEEALKEFYKKAAQRRILLGFVLNHLNQKFKIKLAQIDVQNALLSEARRYPGQEKEVVKFYQDNPAKLSELCAPFLEDKIIDHIASSSSREAAEKKLTLEKIKALVEDENHIL